MLLINGWGNLLPLIFVSAFLIIYKLHNNLNKNDEREDADWVGQSVTFVELMNSQNHLPDDKWVG